MTKQVREIQPINSIVFASGGGSYEVPTDQLDKLGSTLWVASPSCVLICVFPEVDGPTELTLGPSSEVDPGWPPGFVGTVDTPNGELLIDTVDQEIVLRAPATSLVTSLRIWFSHPRWPDRVLIGID